MDFGDWLKEEMDRQGLGTRELARLSGLGTGTVPRVLNGTRKPGPDFCRNVARALRIPEEEVFRRAGLLSKKHSPLETELLRLFSELNTAEQEALLRQLRKR